MTATQLAYQLMTEAELDKQIKRLCRDLNLLGYHTRDSRGSTAGYPDWTICGPAGVIFAECKSERGTLRPEQRDWRDQLLDAGARWHLWRPSHLASGEIARTLAAISSYRGRQP